MRRLMIRYACDYQGYVIETGSFFYYGKKKPPLESDEEAAILSAAKAEAVSHGYSSPVIVTEVIDAGQVGFLDAMQRRSGLNPMAFSAAVWVTLWITWILTSWFLGGLWHRGCG